MIINLELEDVDSFCARCFAAEMPMIKILRNEPFGQRHFITADPNGILIDVVKPIPPSVAVMAGFSGTARAETAA